jgi:hypothetical protein
MGEQTVHPVGDGEEPTSLAKEEVQLLWQWSLHEDGLFTNRMNFFLVAESMLVAAYATLVAGTESSRSNAPLIVASTGMAVALVWAYLAWYQVKRTMDPVKRELRQTLQVYTGIVRGRRLLLPANVAIGYILPALLVIMWIVLLAWPNKPLQPPAYSVRSFLAPASGSG